jgi:hypothetical protein
MQMRMARCSSLVVVFLLRMLLDIQSSGSTPASGTVALTGAVRLVHRLVMDVIPVWVVTNALLQ